MATITIRNLDDQIKKQLKLSAAQNGHSMEEEARLRLSQNSPMIAMQSTLATPHILQSLADKKILLIIGGGIAAYKALDLIRRLKERGAQVKTILTHAAQQFITPLSVSALSGESAYIDLLSTTTEEQIGHIGLANWPDLIIVAPLTANRMAKIVQGFGDDLAGAVLLANRNPVLLAPAMNPNMWENPATQRNYQQLLQDQYFFIGPEIGEMAEKNSYGRGRLSEPLSIVAQVESMFKPQDQSLKNRKIVVTAGPTQENLDPIRYLSNHSSGKQGYAIAQALAELGAQVTLVSGPCMLPPPNGVNFIAIRSADEMHAALLSHLPCDCAILSAAVADWKAADISSIKIKKHAETNQPLIQLVENIDILANLGHSAQKPPLLIGFAAETHNLLEYAERKKEAKNADWILANDVSVQHNGDCVMGGDHNHIFLLSDNGIEEWPSMTKSSVAKQLAKKIAQFFAKK